MTSYTNMEVEEGGQYLKIRAGESVQFHILSKEPIKTTVHWISRKKYDCLGPTCEYCSSGDRPKKGWKIRVFDRSDKSVKTYEFGSQVAAQIKNIAELLAEDQKTVEDIDLRIKREGAGLEDTSYFVNNVSMKDPVPAEARKESETHF